MSESQLAKQFGPLGKIDKPTDDPYAHEHRVPIVGPNGEFKLIRCGRGHETCGGDRPLVYSAEIGRPEVPERYRKKGWIKYEDLCADKPEYFDNWQRVDNDAKRGARMTGMPADFYHPEVYRRRAMVRNGQPLVSIAESLARPKAVKRG